MKILLTGACGLVGRAIRKMAADDHELVLTDRAEQITSEGGHQADITDANAMRQLAEGCDAIIHTAALHGQAYGKAPNSQFIRVNVGGAENLFQAALTHGIQRLVLSSTMEVLIGRGWHSYGTSVVDETLPPRPDWIYPATKVMVEQLGSFYAQHHGLEVINLRYMGVEADMNRLGWKLLARGIHPDDVARANLLSATKPGLHDEVLNIGVDSPLQQHDVNQAMHGEPWAVLHKYYPNCREVIEAAGIEPDIRMFAPVTRIDRAKQILGWHPQITFPEYLRNLGWNPEADY